MVGRAGSRRRCDGASLDPRRFRRRH
jgi:hypothetical protein